MPQSRSQTTPSAAADFVVSPQGDDGNPGTADRPFRSLARAQEAVRAVIARGLTRDLTVLLRDGTHALSEPLVFDARDSGTRGHSITYAAYPGERPLISGGRAISGWKRDARNLYSAGISDARSGAWLFRSLFVGDARAPRARIPHRDDEQPYVKLAEAALSDDFASFTVTVPPGAVRSWENIEDVEVVVLGSWEITRKRLASADEATGRVTLAPPHVAGHDAIRPRAGMACHFENVFEPPGHPGEWYLDRSAGVLYYHPTPDEDPGAATVVAPVLTRLVEIAGTPEVPVRNLHFRGLRFAHTDWPLPPHGYNGIQACFYYPPRPSGKVQDEAIDSPRIDCAIEWRCAVSCSLVDCEIAHTGGGGLSLRKGCAGNLIARNHLFDVGANGIMVGENKAATYPGGREPAPNDVPRRNIITDNRIHDCGVDYYGAVGIWVAFTDATIVAHNLVYDLPYTGISVGFIWDDTPTVCRNNVIERNHIHDVMKMLADGGGIYTLGLQPGTVLRGNLIHDVHRNPSTFASSPNNGIFFDQGSSGYLVEDNIIYNTPEGAVRFNQTKEELHTWRNNSFDVPPESPEFPRDRAQQAGPQPRADEE